MKDYLELEARSTIQTAFQIQLIIDGHVWIDALNKRNLMAHTYDEEVAKEAEELMNEKYYPAIKELGEHIERVGKVIYESELI